MGDKITDFENYKNILLNKRDLDAKSKSVDDLSLEELEDVQKLYVNEIYQLAEEIKTLEEDVKKLKEKT